MDLALQFALAATVLTAAVIDGLRQRIPNWLTLPATVLALCLQFADGGSRQALGGLFGLFLGFSLLIGFYAKGGMGAGDVKLMACIGAFTGPYRVFWIWIYTSLLGGIYALAILGYSIAVRGGWTVTGRQQATDGTSMLLTGGEVEVGPSTAGSPESYPRLRYAIAMALAVITEHILGALV